MPKLLHRLVPTLGLLFGLSSAHAEAPRCSDADLLKGLSEQAVETIKTSVQLFSGFRNRAPAPQIEARVTAMYQVGVTDAERTCHGTLVVSRNGTSTEVDVDYSMIATEDGATLFHWSPPADFVDIFLILFSTPPARDTPQADAPPAAPVSPAPPIPPIVEAEPPRPAPSTAPERGLRFTNSIPYAQARVRLRSLGFTPFKAPAADRCASDSSEARCYPEMEACAGTREGNCVYDWRRRFDTIKVLTVDDPPRVVGLECPGTCDPGLDLDQQLAPAKPPQRPICSSTGTVSGLDPNGDGFLSVRGGPGRDRPELDRLHNGAPVSICHARGPWYAIVYSPTGEAELCKDGLWSDPNQPSGESCRSGWVSSHFVGDLAD